MSFPLVAQDKGGVIATLYGNRFFINLPNKIELGFQGFCGNEKELTFICEKCDSIVNGSDKYTYFVYTRKIGSLKLEVYANTEEDTTDVLISQSWYNVDTLPSPSVKFGSYFSSQQINLENNSHKRFFAKYPPSIDLEATFSVDSWMVQINDKVFKGKGSNFSEELNQFLFEENHSDKFKIEVCLTVNSPDQIQREICDVFRVKPN
ncbi:MAG: hypothetical protein COA32_15905 [Fluviicola sp.]|nr:MAG: hypothetical protein COA32_15905 [Fluviicola sp.]